MHLIGYFEGIDSERGLEWRCADSLSLREFLRLGTTEPVPDHSWLSKTRSRLPLEVHEAVFAWVSAALGRARPDQGRPDRRRCLDHGGQRGAARHRPPRQRRRLPGDAAAAGQGERDRDTDGGRPHPAGSQPTGKRLSNADWASPSDPEAKIAKLKDGRTRLAYKPEHAVDLDTGAIVAAEIHPADQGDTTTLPGTLPGRRSQPGGGRRRARRRRTRPS